MLLGRHKAACLGCGFAAPHVKRNEGKKAYIHCPECGLTVSARNGQQEAGILSNMRPELHTEIPRRPDDIVVKPEGTPAAAAPAPIAPAAPAAPARPTLRTLLG